MNKEEKTIKKIQELVPSIMDLKMGCKVNIEGQMKICLGENMFRDLETADVDEYMLYQKDNDKDWFEILGRPISLEDVMIAVSKKQGEWYITFWGNGVIRIAENIDWMPNKPFHEQSQKCKDFIGDLLLAE